LSRRASSAALCILIGVSAAQVLADPVAPKLEDLSRQTPAHAEAPAEPALRIPDHVTICIDRDGRRCWSATCESECRVDGRSGAVFRTVPNTEAGNAGAALTECWAEVGSEPEK